jgi:hypothetical protein
VSHPCFLPFSTLTPSSTHPPPFSHHPSISDPSLKRPMAAVSCPVFYYMPAPIFLSSIESPLPSPLQTLTLSSSRPPPFSRHPYWLPPSSNTVSGPSTARHSSPFGSERTSTHALSYRCPFPTAATTHTHSLLPHLPSTGSPPFSCHLSISHPSFLKYPVAAVSGPSTARHSSPFGS